MACLQMTQVEDDFAHSCDSTQKACDEYANRVSLELQTGGNIRLEAGKPEHSWYSSCIDLVTSRFNIQDRGSSIQSGDFRITSVTKIHNRYLKNR